MARLVLALCGALALATIACCRDIADMADDAAAPSVFATTITPDPDYKPLM